MGEKMRHNRRARTGTVKFAGHFAYTLVTITYHGVWYNTRMIEVENGKAWLY